MGVHGLWRLLDSFGQVTNPEAWSGRRVAIDASIWIAQFRAKAELGDNVERRVLEGFFARILKLLFYNIDAVFVFDGRASELKTAEQRRRQRHREDATQSFLRRRARQIVMAQVAAGVLDVHTLPLDHTTSSSSSSNTNTATRTDTTHRPRRRGRNTGGRPPARATRVDASRHSVDRATTSATPAPPPSLRTDAESPRRRRWRPARDKRLAPADISAAVTQRFLHEARERVAQVVQDTRRVTHNVLRHSSTALFMGPRRVLTPNSPLAVTGKGAEVVNVDEETESDDDDDAVVVGEDSGVIHDHRGAFMRTNMKRKRREGAPHGSRSCEESVHMGRAVRYGKPEDDDAVVVEEEVSEEDVSADSARATDDETDASYSATDGDTYHDDDEDSGVFVDDYDSEADDADEKDEDNARDVLNRLEEERGSEDEFEEVYLTSSSHERERNESVEGEDGLGWCPGSQWVHCPPLVSPDPSSAGVTTVCVPPSSEDDFTPVKGYSSSPPALHPDAADLPHPTHALEKGEDALVVTPREHVRAHVVISGGARADEAWMVTPPPTTSSSTRVLPPDLADIARLLELCGLPYVISPVEADAQCAFLGRARLVDAVFSEDSDVVVHGAPVVLRGFFSAAQQVVEYRQAELAAVGLGKRVLVALAMLLGCDYTAGVAGLGLTSALDAITVSWPVTVRAGEDAEIDARDAGVGVRGTRLKSSQGGGTHTQKIKQGDEQEARPNAGEEGCVSMARIVESHAGWSSVPPSLTPDATARQEVEAVRRVLSRWRALKEHVPSTGRAALTRLQHEIWTRRRLAWAAAHVDQDFPSARVAEAFICPTVDANTTPFATAAPNWDALRSFAGTRGLLTLHWVRQRYELAQREFDKRAAEKARQQRQREQESARGQDGSATLHQSKLTDFGLQNKVGERWAFRKLSRTYAVALSHLREVQGRGGGDVNTTT